MQGVLCIASSWRKQSIEIEITTSWERITCIANGAFCSRKDAEGFRRSLWHMGVLSETVVSSEEEFNT